MAVTSFGKDMGPGELKAMALKHIEKASFALDRIKSIYHEGWIIPVSPFAENLGESHILDMERNCAVALVALDIMEELGYDKEFVYDSKYNVDQIRAKAEKYIVEALFKEYEKPTGEDTLMMDLISKGRKSLKRGEERVHGLNDYYGKTRRRR